MKATKFNTLSLFGFLGLLAVPAIAQTPGVLYTWAPAGVQDWNRAFGAANTSATLSNPGGSLQIV